LADVTTYSLLYGEITFSKKRDALCGQHIRATEHNQNY